MIIDDSAKFLSRLPGLGPRSAQRLLVHLLEHRSELLAPLVTIFQHLHDNACQCDISGHWDDTSPCGICADTSRSSEIICVVADSLDL
nr:recombination protein RecR [Alphaproteobacteria bacterium]